MKQTSNILWALSVALWIHGAGVGAAQALNLLVENGDVTLGGTLILPKSEGPHAAVVVVHGSGRATRSEGVPWMNTLRDAGIAVLAYDKRGVGQSTGTYEPADLVTSPRLFADLAGDALAWVDLLASREDIRSESIGLVGVSQAGWIMPLAASLSSQVAFVVSVNGPAVSVGKEIYYSHLTAGHQFRLDGTVNGYTIEQLVSETRAYAGPTGYEPSTTLTALTTPILWIYGEFDESQPTALCVEVLEEMANPVFDVVVYPRANHRMIDIQSRQAIPYITTPGGARDWIVDILSGSVQVQATSWSNVKARFRGVPE